jgi:L-threonylcarbamoyladenylate synthase
MDDDLEKAINVLLNGGVVIARTDTIYGILARADLKKAVEKVFEIKNRNLQKPNVILLTKYEDLPNISEKNRQTYQKLNQERPTTIVLPASDNSPEFLTRGGKSLAFRVVENHPNLIRIIERTGKLIAPSANPENKAPARNITEARRYFGKKIDFYLDDGEVAENLPSRIIQIDENGTIKTLRGKT